MLNKLFFVIFFLSFLFPPIPLGREARINSYGPEYGLSIPFPLLRLLLRVLHTVLSPGAHGLHNHITAWFEPTSATSIEVQTTVDEEFDSRVRECSSLPETIDVLCDN